MRRILTRLAALLALAGGALVVVAPPASAHTVAGSGATNFQTNLNAVSPSVPGLHFRVIENGARVEFSYSGKGEFVVPHSGTIAATDDLVPGELT